MVFKFYESELIARALLHNTNHKFICKNVFLYPTTKNSLITNQYSESAIKIPIAHGEGRFTDEKTLSQIVENDQILFKYCDEKVILQKNQTQMDLH